MRSVYQKDRLNERWMEKRERQRKGHGLPRIYIKLSTRVPSVAETATKKSDFLVITEAVQNTDVIYGAAPLSLEIDGCQ